MVGVYLNEMSYHLQGQGLTNDDINSQVYEQWLLADLHELETCCLPGEITTSQKFELIGTFALQVLNVSSTLKVGAYCDAVGS
jgi:hypothetical protein